jgi:hypothetical protein
MFSNHSVSLFLFAFQTLFNPIVANSRSCRAIPNDPLWPSDKDWTKLNSTIKGRLIKASPPAAPCHATQPSFNNATCAYIQAAWRNSTFHDEDPVSVEMPNWTNETCLPIPQAPCSGEGYPVYVINATTPAHVKAGVDFARKWNIRLVVKSTGHDYIGR